MTCEIIGLTAGLGLALAAWGIGLLSAAIRDYYVPRRGDNER